VEDKYNYDFWLAQGSWFNDSLEPFGMWYYFDKSRDIPLTDNRWTERISEDCYESGKIKVGDTVFYTVTIEEDKRGNINPVYGCYFYLDKDTKFKDCLPEYIWVPVILGVNREFSFSINEDINLMNFDSDYYHLNKDQWETLRNKLR
jgi:hypothetical protein